MTKVNSAVACACILSDEKTEMKKIAFAALLVVVAFVTLVSLFGGEITGNGSSVKADESGNTHDLAAVRDGCLHVQQVEQHRSTVEDGNYKFSVWEATGII